MRETPYERETPSDMGLFALCTPNKRRIQEKETSKNKKLVRDSKERETFFEVSFSLESLSLIRDSKKRK